jgi:hypothetical protein
MPSTKSTALPKAGVKPEGRNDQSVALAFAVAGVINTLTYRPSSEFGNT